jgi:hypothetical protein
MKILLNNVKKSDDNPQLTEAIAEINKLNHQLALIKSAVESTEVMQRTNDEAFEKLHGQRELQAKLDFIYEIVNPSI